MSKIRLGPMISLRTLRESKGLTSRQLADKIGELGVTVDDSSLRHIELGHYQASRELAIAWATALNVHPDDVMSHDRLAEYLRLQAEAGAAA
jgi:transcriptional regulator with XRE-family HTH domain